MYADWIIPLTFLGGTLAVLAFVSVGVDLHLHKRAAINERLRREFPGAGRSPRSPLFRDIQLLAAEANLSKPSPWVRLRAMVQQSGLGLSVSQVLGISLGLGLTTAAAALLVTQRWGFVVAGLVVGVVAPLFYVHSRQAHRTDRLRHQLPDALGLMSRAVRAGQTVSGALKVVANSLDPPLAEEFAQCADQEKLGLSQEVALRELAQRTALVELRILAVALIVQRQAGGNPVEVLNNLAEVIRKRIKLAGKVKALTAEGRMQAIVLSVLPVVMLVVMYLLNRDYAQVLLDRPYLLLGMFVSQAIGALWIRRLIRFDS